VQAVCSYITSAGVPSIITTDNYSHLYQWIKSGGTYVSNSSLDAVSGPAYDGWGLVVDSSKNIFMTDGQSNQIFKILPNGSYSIFAGTGFSAGSADGTGAAARFNGITGITIDSSNNLYASDTGNKTIRKITPAGVVTTIAGTARSSGSTDAAGSSARFNSPWDIDIDAAGNLYIADRGNNSIRKLTLSGATYTASTIAGSAGSPGSTDGTGSAARFNTPTGLAVDASGIIYVSDTGNNTIRRLAPPSMTIDVEGTDSASHSGAITVGILNKTDAGSLALSGANAIGNLAIQGGKVAVSSASNLNGASSAVIFAASGTDPVTGAANTATLQIAGTMDTGAFAFTSAGTVQVDGSNVATLNVAPTGTGLVHKTGPGVMKVASDLSASAALAGIHVDAGTLYVQSGKAPVAPIAVASSAVMELGAGLAAGSVGGAVTVASGAEMLVDASATVPHQNSSLTYTFNATTGYYMSGSTALAWPTNFISYAGLGGAGHPNWRTNDASNLSPIYAGITMQLHAWTGTGGGNTYYKSISSFVPYSVTSGSDQFSGGLLFQSGSKLALGAGSTWARDITVGTSS
jgi:sugar lactone lactonase YvrE